MPSLRFVLPASALLMLGLCWSVNANTTERTQSAGFVTNYITPVTNLSLDKLLGRWYVAEFVSFESVPNTLTDLCLLLDFYYNDNGTLVVAPITIMDGFPHKPAYALPVTENGVWDAIRNGELISSHAVVHVDDRFLAVASCKNAAGKQCGAFVMVRQVADADRQGQLADLHRLVAGAGVDDTVGDYVRVIEACRAAAATAPAPGSAAQNATSAAGTE